MKHVLVILILTALISCNPKVVSYINSKARFQNFSSYQLVNVKIGKRNLPPEATELLGSIESEIKVEMEQRRNYVTSNIDPDLILRYELVSNTRTERSTNNNSVFNTPSFNSNVVYESVILIELLNNKKLVWQGSYDLTQSRRETRNENAVKKAIGLIFTTYPYTAGKAVSDPALTTKKKK